MSVWTTKGLGSTKNYVVIKHPLKGVNNVVNGVTFREGYAVVEKDSKTYHHLRKIPLLHKAQEQPLTHLRKLRFITRTSDVKMVYGQDVYMAFLNAEAQEKEAKIQEELEAKAAKEAAEQERRKAELEAIKAAAAKQLVESVEVTTEKVDEETVEAKIEIKKCCFVKPDGNLCKHDALDYSPSKYCSLHLLEDDKLSDYGIELPKMMSKQEKKKARKAVHKKLKALKSKGEL